MANTKLLTTKYSTLLVDHIKEIVDDDSNDSLYVYTGVHGDVIGDIPVPGDDTRDTVIDAYRNMIFGKRVQEDDVAALVRNVPYVASTVYAMYDDIDEDLLTKDFYVNVNEGTYYHVYKCLDNNFDMPSTVEPAIAWFSPVSNYIYQTSDGYVWKYLYSITNTQWAQFSTQEYFPVFANSDVAEAAIPGNIDVVHIEQTNLNIPGGGKRYDNYVSGTWSGHQLRILGNNYIYAISNGNISYTAGFYTGCSIYLSSGTGSGQYTTVTDYYTNSSGNYISLEVPFDVNPSSNTTWEITPSVVITGDGTETVNAVARCLINSTGSNSIYKVEMLEKGRDYSYITAYAVANNSVTGDLDNDGIISDAEDRGFIAAELRPIYVPAGGHGADVENELGCNAVNITCTFTDTDSDTILANNRFQQIGMLIDPLFANVNLEIDSLVGTFTDDEIVYKIEPIRINSNVCISNTSNVITGETSVLSSANVVVAVNTGSYVPNAILTISGGTPVVTGKLQVVTTKVSGAVINNGGSGYTINSSFNANLNLGTGTNATFNVTTNSTGHCNSITITTPGSYTVNPPFLANSTPTGTVGGGTGLTVNLQMGVETIIIYDEGAYAILPTDTSNNIPLSNSGAGAQFLLGFTAINSSDFVNQLANGDYIYITAADGSAQQLGVVGSIENATHLTIRTTGIFSCASAKMYLPNKSSYGNVLSSNGTNLVLTNVNGRIEIGDTMVGNASSAKIVIDTIIRNDVDKNLDSFIQLYKYTISVLSGAFVENEFVFQGDSYEEATASALVHSVVSGNNIVLYTSNQVGQFTTNTFIQGDTSLAVASISGSYSPELVFGSGDVLYLENIDPVDREADTSQTIQIILTF